jgi:hypothetical protein
MKRFHTKYQRPDTRYQIFTDPSLTIPDQTMSLRTMVTKYVKGLPITAPNFDGVYTDDQDAIDYRKLDLAEQEEITRSVSNELKSIDDKLTQEKREKAANERKEAENMRLELAELKKQKAEGVALTL